MHFHKPRKKYLCGNIICVACFVIVIACLCIRFIPYPTSRFTPPILTVGISLWYIFLLVQDHRAGLTVSAERIRTTSRGSDFDIDYHAVFSISYSGIPHCTLWDCLILNCGKKRKIYIDAAAYQDYPAIWEQIITYAKAAKPNIVIDPRVQKRLERERER